MADPASIEVRARELYRSSKGGRANRAKGAAPAWCWRQAIAEAADGDDVRERLESDAQRTNRIMREVLDRHLRKLKIEAEENGWL